MKKCFKWLIAIIFATFIAEKGMSAVPTTSITCSSREMDFNANWKFFLGDTPDAAKADFDDSKWRTLDLPHDWSIEGCPDLNNPSGNDGGYYPTGIGWYRKTFSYTPDPKRPETSIYFEGVYMNAEVYVNGTLLGKRPYGYTSFFYNLTEHLKAGQNVIAVRVDNAQQKNCRWYSGSGIYRNVKFIQTPQLHFSPWGIVVRTKVDGTRATIEIEATIKNNGHQMAETTLNSHISNKDTSVKTDTKSIKLNPGETRTVKQYITIDNARLWSPESPELYTLNCTLNNDGDSVHTTFGIRSIEYSAEHGLLLNGQQIKLNGGCLHHDNGCLGAAAWRDAEWRKAKLMKDAGFNAVRTSHNPPSEDFLDACDHLGLLVIDEAFDGWRSAKNTYDYSVCFDKWWTSDLESMVRRDINHPSIFCWSTGNEIIERKTYEAVLTAYAMAGFIHRIDPTRPVTSALTTWDNDWEIFDPLAAAHDIAGYNYQLHRAKKDHERVPSRVIMQTESYPRDAFANWSLVADNSYIIGDFVWTAMDYLGESGIGRYYYKGETEGEHYDRNQFPWHGAYCGDIDITGWRKPISHYRELLYNPDKKLFMAVKEPNNYYGEIKETSWSVWPTWLSWNWPGHEGRDIEVEVYSRYPSVRLYLNNQLVGEKATTRSEAFKATFKLPYTPGTLRAAGVDNGTEVEEQILESAGKAARIRLTADRKEMTADGKSLVYVVAEVTDKEGRVVPDAENKLIFETEGEGTLLATCNAHLTNCDAYTNNVRNAWKGRALAVVKSSQKTGKLTITVKSKGLRKEKLTLSVK